MRLITQFFRLSVCAITLVWLVGPQAQEQPKLLGENTDWVAYELNSGENKICYIASEPLKSNPDMENRGSTWVLVTHRPIANIKNEGSVIAGYPYAVGARVSILIDTKKFEMFTKDNGAWLGSPKEESAIVTAMKRGRRMSVVGYSNSGVTTTDEYSLLGFTASYRRISSECGVR